MVSHDPRIEDLLGAYALDAVDQAERAEVERHLTDCPRCRREVEDHREVAALLSSRPEPAPDTIWTSIEREIAPPASAIPSNVTPLRRRTGLPTWLGAVATVAAFALVASVFVQSQRVEQLSEQVALEQQQIEQITNSLATDPFTGAVEAALANPESRVLTLAATDAEGAGSATVVLTPGGDGFIVDDTLPMLPAGQTYQLWAVTEGRVVSAGLFGADVESGAFHVDLDGLSALAITPEIAGGVVVSEADAVAIVSLEG